MEAPVESERARAQASGPASAQASTKPLKVASVSWRISYSLN